MMLTHPNAHVTATADVVKPATAAAKDAIMCVQCGVKPVSTAGATCSRRCHWAAATCCPQCGRGRSAQYTFCSSQCSVEARQANWCGVCGIRQVSHGYSTCQVCLSSGAAPQTPTTPAGGGAASMSMHSSAPHMQSFNSIASSGSFSGFDAAASHGASEHGSGYGASYFGGAPVVSGYAAGAASPMEEPYYAATAPVSNVYAGSKVIAPSAGDAYMPEPQPQAPMMPPPQPHHQQPHNSHGHGRNSGSRRQGSGGGHGPRGNGGASQPHEILAAGHKSVGPVLAPLGDHADAVAAIVKVGGPSAARKRYLAYRTRVEDDLARVCGHGAPKYGHGGEGNEQRRFMPLTIECVNPAYGSTEPCPSATCQYSSIMRQGHAALASLGQSSHYTVGSMKEAFRAAVRNNQAAAHAMGTEPMPLVAVAVCRVVVGNPTFADEPAHVAPPAADHHAVVVKPPTPPASENGKANPFGGTPVANTGDCFVFEDDAVDLIYVVVADAAAASAI